MSTRRTILVFVTFLLAGGGGGCARAAVYTVATADVRAANIIRAAPKAGVYAVAWSGDGKTFRRDKDEVARIVRQDDALGFETGFDGSLVAIAAGERIRIDAVPGGARFVAWQSTDTVQTGLGRGVAMTLATPVVVVSGAAGMLTAIVASWGNASPGQSGSDKHSDSQEDPFGTRAQIRARQQDDKEDAKLRAALGLPWKKPKYGYPGDSDQP